MDRTGASFWHCVEMITERLGANPVHVQIPIGAESAFKGIIDLIENRAYIYTDDLNSIVEPTDIPASMAEEAATHREKMVELIVESDDELTLRYLEGEEITPDEL